jgi:DNA-directed RNA polymerase specialized sigma24 family protein
MENPYTNQAKIERNSIREQGVEQDRREALAYQIAGRNDWDVIDQIDGFLDIFDRLPKRMRLIVDMKMTGTPDEDIAKMMDISVKTVKNKLTEAKKRFLVGLF